MADEDRDRGLGFCQWLDCARYAVVTLNGGAMCLAHFDQGMRETMDAPQAWPATPDGRAEAGWLTQGADEA